ncbi:hypothetical protein [Altericista sp. CCNU0014]|uniref:hypothetical protein n=1 Tax=Altericista sp. CCNU0014 TaxID=3082949 RepID=UPI0038511373
MKGIEILGDGKFLLETSLTPGQVSKFNGLVDNLIIEKGTAYVPIDQLHGVLLTSSKAKAQTIVNNHADVVKAYLVREPILFAKHKVSSAINPVGLYNLLEELAKENPARATEYRASLALLSTIIANHPQLALSAQKEGKSQKIKNDSIFSRLKKKHAICQLSQKDFTNDEKHVHHIEGKSEDPSLVNDEKNLIVIKGTIHNDYHGWLSKKGYPINKGSLKLYAKEKNYSISAIDDCA